MSIKAMRDAIVTAVGSAMPGLRECRPFEGQFTSDDLRRTASACPAVFVSCVGIAEVEDYDDELVAIGQWSMTVVARRQTIAGRTEASRADEATAIIETLIPLIRDSNSAGGAWATESEGPPDRIRARNVFATDTDAKGVTLWIVTWEQPVALVSWDAAELDALLRIDTSFSQGGATTPQFPATTTFEAPP